MRRSTVLNLPPQLVVPAEGVCGHCMHLPVQSFLKGLSHFAGNTEQGELSQKSNQRNLSTVGYQVADVMTHR